MKKKFLCLAMAIIGLAMATISISAVQPRWSYTNSVIFNLYFDDELGSIEGTVCGYSDVTKIEGTITLYRKNILGIWSKTGDSWTVTTTSHVLDIWETFTATSGKQYKVELEATVYSGSNSETITSTATNTCP